MTCITKTVVKITIPPLVKMLPFLPVLLVTVKKITEPKGKLNGFGQIVRQLYFNCCCILKRLSPVGELLFFC